jgi:hypothetical protein
MTIGVCGPKKGVEAEVEMKCGFVKEARPRLVEEQMSRGVHAEGQRKPDVLGVS